MFEVKTKMTIKLPDLDFTKTFEDVSRLVIIPDIRLGINRGIGVDGQEFPPLEPSTLLQKSGARKRALKSGGKLGTAGLAGGRGGTQTLVNTGLLRESFEYQRVATNHVRISISDVRSEIGKFLQIDGVGKKKKKFFFFGISQRAEFQAVALMRARLAEILGKSNGK